MRRFLPVLALLAALPVQAATSPWAGAWFGTGQPDDKSEMYIDYFNADGSFHNHHRWCRQGKALDTSETGLWVLKSNMLTIAIEKVDGKDDPRMDTYKVLSVDAKTQSYVYLKTNFAYHANRVAADFEMPSCDLTS